MPLMDGNLGDEISQNTNMTDEGLGVWILYDILCAVAHMHRRNIAHRDIKPHNILLARDLHRFPLGVRVAVCDFGSAHYATDHFQRANSINQRGTLCYMAPEALLGSMCASAGLACDMWSFGCVMGEVLTGRALFAGESQLRVLRLIASSLGSTLEHFPNVTARAGLLEELQHQISPVALDLLGRLLTLDSHSRISAEDALAHPFFEAVVRYYASDASGLNGRLPQDGPSMEGYSMVPLMKLEVTHQVPELSTVVFQPIVKPSSTSVAETSHQFCSFNSTETSIHASALRTHAHAASYAASSSQMYLHCSGNMTASNQRVHRPLFSMGDDSGDAQSIGLRSAAMGSGGSRRTGPHHVEQRPLGDLERNHGQHYQAQDAACKFLAFDSPQRPDPVERGSLVH